MPSLLASTSNSLRTVCVLCSNQISTFNCYLTSMKMWMTSIVIKFICNEQVLVDLNFQIILAQRAEYNMSCIWIHRLLV